MTTKAKNDLHVEPETHLSSVGGPSPTSSRDNPSPPSVALLSIQSSSSASETDVQCLTPRNQPIMTPGLREEKAKEFVHEIGLQWLDCTEKQRIRAKKIQSPDFTWSPTKGDAGETSRYTTTFEVEWEQFIGDLSEPHRAALSTFDHVFFDKPATKNYMAIRKQLSGICSAHASVLFQHYVESCRRGSQEENHKMLDISTFIRKDVPVQIQKRYITEGVTGYNSFELVQLFTGTKDDQYLQLKPCKKSWDEDLHSMAIKALFDAYVTKKEPGLISYFKVGGEFSENTILEGPLDEERYKQIVVDRGGKANIHSMIMIGAYHSDNDDRYWFLLQNTHQGDFFKIVDGEHLASCDATVSFAGKHVDMSLKGDYNVVIGEYSEAAFDMEECAAKFEAEG